MAFDQLKYLISADASEFKQELRQANDSFERFRQENRYAIRDMKAWGAAAVAGAAAGAVAIGNMVDTTADEAVQMERLARVTGLTVEEMGRLAYAAAAMGDSNYTMSDAADDVADAIATITDRAEDAKAGVQSMVDDFALVGVEVQDLRAKKPRELLNTFADAIANAENKNKALTAGVRILGDDLGRRLLPMLMEGSDGIERLGDKGERLGRVMNKDLVESAENWNRAMRELNDIMVGTRNEIADEILPAVGDLIDVGAEVARWGGFIGNVLITLGGVLDDLLIHLKQVGDGFEALGHWVTSVTHLIDGNLDAAIDSMNKSYDAVGRAMDRFSEFGDSTAAASSAGDEFQASAFRIADQLQSVAARARGANDELKELTKTFGRDSTIIGSDGRAVTLTGGLSPATLELLEQAEKEQETESKKRARRVDDEVKRFAESMRDAARGPIEEYLEKLDLLRRAEERQLITGDEYGRVLQHIREQYDPVTQAARELREEAEALRESLKSPGDRYLEEEAKLGEMLQEDLITVEEYDQALRQLNIEYGGSAATAQELRQEAAALADELKEIGGGQFSANVRLLKEQFTDGAIGADEFRRGLVRVNEAADEFADLEVGAEELKDSFLTPLDKAYERIAEFRKMFSEGLISRQQLEAAKTREIEEARQKQFAGFYEEEKRRIEASKQEAERWSEAWQNAIHEAVTTAAESGIEAFFSMLKGETKDATEALKELGGELLKIGARAAIMGAFQTGGGSSSTAGTLGFASGGYVSGPGTSTSDSIPAYLSDGEYVMRAKAVDHVGVGFMEAVNNLEVPGSRKGYASGGLVKSGGGSVNLTINNITDPREIEEVMASPTGERVVWNLIERRREEFSQMLKVES